MSTIVDVRRLKVKESGVVNVDQLEGVKDWVNSIGWRGETCIQCCSRNT